MMADGLPKRTITFYSMVVFVLISVVIVIMSIVQLCKLARYSGMISIAEELDKGYSIPPSRMSAYEDMTGTIVADDICSSDILAAGATVQLSNLDQINVLTEYEKWAAALAGAEAYFKHAAGCAPTDGNYWLRLAMIKQAIAERPEETASLLRLSARWAPSEGEVVFGRVMLWNKVTPATLDLSGALVQRDVDIFLRYGDVGDIVPVFRSLGARLRPYVAEGLHRLSDSRLTEFRKAGLNLDAAPPTVPHIAPGPRFGNS